MDSFGSWPLSKQYLAGHFYLSEEKPISISEAQRAQLGALHLFVSFGKYSPDRIVPDLELCSQAERKKRTDEWKKLSSLSKSTAMQKFLDLLSSLFPNWSRSRKLLYEFQVEWQTLQQKEVKAAKTQEKGFKNLKVLKKPAARSLVSNVEIMNLSYDDSKKLNLTKLKVPKLKFNNSRFNRTQSIDIQNTLYSFKEIDDGKKARKFSTIEDSILKYKTTLANTSNLKNFIEDLQSYKGGNIKDTSASRFPKVHNSPVIELPTPDPPVNFEKELKQYRRSLLQKEFNKFISPDRPTLHSGFDKIHETISSLKLVLQKLNDN